MKNNWICDGVNVAERWIMPLVLKMVNLSLMFSMLKKMIVRKPISTVFCFTSLAEAKADMSTFNYLG